MDRVQVLNVSKYDALSAESCRIVFVGLLLSLAFPDVKIYVKFYRVGNAFTLRYNGV